MIKNKANAGSQGHLAQGTLDLNLTLKPHDNFAFYAEKLAQSAFSPWRGTIFRSATMNHASAADLISGRGLAIAGGRWNPPGIRTVYGALEPGLSVDESFGIILHGFGLDVDDIRPRMVAGIELSFQAVLFLDPARSIPDWINYDQMLSVDWRAENNNGRETASQAFGRAVASVGEALITRSAVRPGLNIAIFPDSIRAGSDLRVIDADELPG
jgi:hypothetical protein